MKTIFTILLLSIYSGLAIGEEQYLCIEDQATGYTYKKNTDSWKKSSFVAGKKFLVKTTKKDSKDYMTATIFGQSVPEYQCHNKLRNDFRCADNYGHFIFNENNLKFIMSYVVGYTDGEKSSSDTPTISIGTCTPL